MLRKPVREINDQLNTRLTPRVINRLRLRAIHARKIRCTNKETLPLAPTAERLPEIGSLQEKASTATGIRSQLLRSESGLISL